MIPVYVNAEDLSKSWDVTVRHARRVISGCPDRVKIRRRWYAPLDALQRQPRGNPHLTAGDPHQRAAARARWKK